VYLNPQAADLVAEFPIAKQAHDVVLDPRESDSFAQHRDQVGLCSACSKLVDYVDMKHD
jgi:hypothetical protein